MDKRKDDSLRRRLDEEALREGRDAARAAFTASEPIRIRPARRETKLISIRLPLELLHGLWQAAASKDMGYQQIMKIYIAEGLRADSAGSGNRMPSVGIIHEEAGVYTAGSSWTFCVPSSTPVSGV